MNKPEYSDLYKFIVSIGVVLIGFAFLLPWLFLREPFDILVSTENIAKLSPTAQILISYRQNITLWLVQNILWISAIPALLGIAFLVRGLPLWQRKQKITDKKDELEVEKLSREVKNMSVEQVAVKIIQKTVEESQLKEGEKAVANSQIKAVNEYIRIEKSIFEKILYCFGSGNVRLNQQIKDSSVDLIVRVNMVDRAIFEIKYFKRTINLSHKINSISQTLVNSVQAYKAVSPQHFAYGIGLIILDNEQIDVDKKVKVTTREISGITIKIIMLTENEFINMEINQLKSLVAI